MTESSLPATGLPERPFRIDAALHKAAVALWHNLLPFCMVTGIAALPGLLLSDDAIVSSAKLVWSAVGLVLTLVLGEAPQNLLEPAVGVALGMVLGALSQAIVIRGTLAHMRGETTKPAASLQMATRVFFPVIGAEICVAVLGALGFLFLIVPGYIMLTLLYVAIPVCVAEQRGPWKSLGRSADLVEGNGWAIFGMIIVLGVLESMGTGLAHAIGRGAGANIGLAASLAWSALYGAFSAAMLATTYHDLRAAKEGVDIDQVAQVFD
jgi:hypothetical protein